MEYLFRRFRDEGSRQANKDAHCGYHFAAELRSNPEALGYALAAFAAHHNVFLEDDASASMLEYIYYTGRGGLWDPEKAQEWAEKDKQRQARVGGMPRSR